MKYIKCDILDEKALEMFRGIPDDPKLIWDYVEGEKSRDSGKKLKELETNAVRISAKIERLSEILADTDGSVAVKHILTQIEKEDINLEAVKREIEITKAEEKKDKKHEKSAKEKVEEITQLIRGIDNFSAEEKNKYVRSIVKECTWDGERLFLRI